MQHALCSNKICQHSTPRRCYFWTEPSTTELCHQGCRSDSGGRAARVGYACEEEPQLMLGVVRLLGELYNFQVVSSALIFDFLYHVLNYGHYSNGPNGSSVTFFHAEKCQNDIVNSIAASVFKAAGAINSSSSDPLAPGASTLASQLLWTVQRTYSGPRSCVRYSIHVAYTT